MAKNIYHSTPKFIFLIVITIVFLFTLFLSRKYFSCQKLGCIDMQELDGFQVKDVYHNDKDIYQALYYKNDDLIRIEVRSIRTETEAVKSIEAQTARMKALFENAAAPYPGEITNEIVCDKKFKPVFATDMINDITITHFTGYLNDRLTFGACTEDQAVYRGIEALFYCKNQKKQYQLEIIAPNNAFTANESKYEDMLKSLRCK